MHGKPEFDKWAASPKGRYKNQNEISDNDFIKAIFNIKNNETNDKKYKIVEINDTKSFLYNEDQEIQFMLPRSEYFEFLRRVQTLHPYTKTELKKLKQIFKCIPNAWFEYYLDNHGLQPKSNKRKRENLNDTISKPSNVHKHVVIDSSSSEESKNESKNEFMKHGYIIVSETDIGVVIILVDSFNINYRFHQYYNKKVIYDGIMYLMRFLNFDKVSFIASSTTKSAVTEAIEQSRNQIEKNLKINIDIMPQKSIYRLR